MRYVRFSPYLLVVALSPVFLQTSTPLSCKSGDTTLSEFAVIVDGEDQIVGFDPAQLSYSLSLPLGTDEALIHTASTDPAAQVWIDVLIDDERIRYQHGGLGGGDIVVPLPKGSSTVEAWVRPPGGATDYYEVAIQLGLPCTEEGLRQAVADGGGPHLFDCDEPIVTSSTIYIDEDVKLDGLGTLVVSGGDHHQVFFVRNATVQFRGMTITEGAPVPNTQQQGTAFFNYGGDVTITDCIISDNYRGGIGTNSANLTVINSVITRNTDAYGGGGIALYVNSTLTMIDSVVSDNTSQWYGGIGAQDGSLVTIIRSVLTRNEATVYGIGGMVCGGDCTILDSTVSYNRARMGGGGVGGPGKVTIIGSTIVGNDASSHGGGVMSGVDGELYVLNSTVSGNRAGGSGGGIWLSGGSDARIFNTTVTDNTAQIATALGGAGTLNMQGSIAVGDCTFLGPPPLFATTLEGTPTGAPSESTCFGSVVVPAETLALGPLQDNGGPTETHALLPGSVAIDVIPEAECVDAEGAPLTTDQRGLPRDSMCDVGAFEVQP